MSSDLDVATDLPDQEVAPSRTLRVVLIGILVVAALVIAGAVGSLLGNRGSSSVSASSVDAGFARDMSAHHDQAVQMAGYTRDHTDDPSIKLLAYDIETAQYVELGQMQGWLDGWSLTRSSNIPQMSWMSGHDHLEANGLMPGMATQSEINKLLSLTGKPLDIYFLQLMIRHHQGGIPMAQYAAAHAGQSYVRDLARKMVQNQSNEIVTMEQLLRQLGGSPLPPPD